MVGQIPPAWPGYQLFFHRFFRGRPNPDLGEEQFDLILPIVVTAPGFSPAPQFLAEPALWPFDTCYSGDAISSPEFLESQYDLTLHSGQIPIPRDQRQFILPFNQFTTLRTDGVGSTPRIPIHSASLWLVGNQPPWTGTPILLNTSSGGIVVQPERRRTILGRTSLIGTRLRMIVHFEMSPVVSVWVPDELLERNRKLLENH